MSGPPSSGTRSYWTWAHEGKRPVLTITVQVQEAFLHCAKAFKRSHLWDADAQVPRKNLPSLAEMVYDHTNQEVCSLEELEDYIQQSYETRLYWFESAGRW